MPFDFAAVSAPFRMQPGLRRLPPNARQLTPNQLGDRALHEKLEVLTSHQKHALLVAEGFDAEPSLHALAAHAAGEHPNAFTWDGDAHWQAHHLGWSVQGDAVMGTGPSAIGACLRGLPSNWRAAALLALAFAEDFAVIDGVTAHIPWLAVCLPSHWAPEEKIGRHFAHVHAPVADNQILLAASEHLARLVTGTERWERFVLTVTPHPRLSQHPALQSVPPWTMTGDAFVLARQAFFRTERQTFIPVPELAQAVFTIHVEVQPLIDAICHREHACQLHAAIASMSPAVLAYRGLTDARERLLAWLTTQADA